MAPPTAAEVTSDGLDMVFACCARLQITDALRDAVATRIGSPGGDFSIYQLTQLNQGERDNTVDNVALQDTQTPPQPRLPTLFEKAQIRSLFALAHPEAPSMLIWDTGKGPLNAFKKFIHVRGIDTS